MSVIYGGGAIRYTFDLVSECVDGVKAGASIVAGGFAVGGGVTASGTTSAVEFEDNLSIPDPMVFQGAAKFVGAGYSLGPESKIRYDGKTGGGFAWTVIQLGGARSIPSSPGVQYGLDFSVYGGAGISTVVSSSVESCGCGEN